MAGITETKQLSIGLPFIFHNAFVDHELDGSHLFPDTGSDPTQAGEFQRVKDRLKFHDGAIVQILAWLKDFTGFVNRLALSYLSASSVRIAPGICLDDTALGVAVSPEVIKSTANIDVDITVSGINGLDFGVEAANTWYYVWIIRNPTTGLVKGLLSLSDTAPTMPVGYTKKRRIGIVRNNGASDFLNFAQFGRGTERYYEYREALNSTLRVLSGGTSATWTDVDCSAFVPPITVWPLFSAQNDVPAVGSAGQFRTKGLAITMRVVTTSDGRVFYLETDASGFIQYQRIGPASINVSVIGFREEL